MPHALITAYIDALDAEERAARELKTQQNRSYGDLTGASNPPAAVNQAVATARAGVDSPLTTDLAVLGEAILERDALADDSPDTTALEAAVDTAHTAVVAARTALYSAARAAAA